MFLKTKKPLSKMVGDLNEFVPNCVFIIKTIGYKYIYDKIWCLITVYIYVHIIKSISVYNQ